MVTTRRLALGALTLLVLAGCALGRPAPPSKADLVRRVLPSVVELVYEHDRAPVRFASGVVLGSRGADATGRPAATFILTSAHAVVGHAIDGAQLTVRHRDADDALRKLPGAVEAVDEADDLAVVRVDGLRLPAARLPAAGARLGEEIVVIGAPFGRGLSVSSGIVSQLTVRTPDGRAERDALLKIDAPVGYGSSGGGVFSARDGRLLGVVEGYRTATVSMKLAGEPYSFQVPMPGETFVVPASEIRRFLDAHRFERLLVD